MINIYERIKDTDIDVYRGLPDQDLTLARWWMNLHESNDILQITWSEQQRTLANFLGLFRSPTILLYSMNKSFEIEYALWFERFATGAFAAIWADAKCRGEVKYAKRTLYIYSLMLSIYPTILSVTHQPHVIDLMSHIGYKQLGDIPHIFGEESRLGYITTEIFNEKWGDKLESNKEMRD